MLGCVLFLSGYGLLLTSRAEVAKGDIPREGVAIVKGLRLEDMKWAKRESVHLQHFGKAGHNASAMHCFADSSLDLISQGRYVCLRVS